MPKAPERGEIWLADLGPAAKVRPVLVVSIPFGDDDYALIQVVPHTTQKRGSQFSIEIPVRFLESSVFNIQGMLAIPTPRFERLLGRLTSEQIKQIEKAIQHWLGLTID
jgi:mRNA interferase MazF